MSSLDEQGRLRFTRPERLALFAGNPVRITFPGKNPCPVEPGHVEVLSANVRLEITGTRRAKDGSHVLIYTLHNNRLGARFLSRRGDEHGYSHSGSDVDEQAGEAVDEFTQRKITKDAKARERQAVTDLIVAAEDVMSAIDERLSGSEARLTKHRIRRELDRLIDRQRRKAA